MKIRFHRGTLEEAMKTVVEIPATRKAVADRLTQDLGRPVLPKDLVISNYCRDDRIGWDTHLVSWKGQAVAFTDSPVQ